MLPHEREVKLEIARQFEKVLSFSSGLLGFGSRVLGWADAGQGGRVLLGVEVELSQNTVHLAIGIFAKACNQLRAIRLLCAQGFSDEADVLSRSLFETTLALHFVVQGKLTLLEQGKPPTRTTLRGHK